MSVPSSKTTVTTDSPNWETERISVTRGTPRTAASTGTVMNCSTSSAPSAGAVVMTWTWTLVTSGTASTGSRPTAQTPAAASTSDASTTTNLLSRARSISLVIGT